MPVTGLGNSQPPPSTIPSVPEGVALRFEPVFPDAHRPSIQQGTLLACLDLLAPDSCATPVRICALSAVRPLRWRCTRVAECVRVQTAVRKEKLYILQL